MAGLLDIQSIYPELALNAKRDEQAEKLTGYAGLENLARKSQARLSAGLRGGLSRATGNEGLLTNDQRFMRALQGYDPEDQNADMQLLEAAKQFAPQRVPALISAMEKKRIQEHEESLQTQANQRANDAAARDAKRFGLEEERWTNFKEQQEIENGWQRERLANEQTRLGIDERQIQATEANLELGKGRNAREIREFAIMLQERGNNLDQRESMAAILEDQGMELLAEGMRAPGSNMNAILGEAAAIQKARITESIAKLELEQGSPPSEATTDSFVTGTIDKLDTIDPGSVPFFGNEENSPEVAYLLRIWYQGGGYMAVEANPVEGRRAALEFVKKNASFFEDEDTDVGTGGGGGGPGMGVPNRQGQQSPLSRYER